ncbi:phosphomannomutase [Vibrio alginolyticus]|nr:phosphomannomutase [Vibrio alginolyticus]
MLVSKKVIEESGIVFGTSGARGLVEQFIPIVCAAFTHAFIETIKEHYSFNKVAIAIDNRPSSPNIAASCIAALEQAGIEHVYYGVIPTPALAYVAMQESIPCIMVTGSHIPFDRNGLKFYRPDGEITKSDESAILNTRVEYAPLGELPILNVDNQASERYIERYTGLFKSDLLAGKRIGIYEHSSAGRELYRTIFERLGADVVSLGRSDEFVPIDTEAVSESDIQQARFWSTEYSLDAIFSTDGDGDRPLLADENGNWLRGDILGLLCSSAMGIEAVAVPVSCNTAIEVTSKFKKVVRTKIGSPYVIAEFDNLYQHYKTVAGFEANGGYMLGSDVAIDGNILKSLPTRDAVLPAIMTLIASKREGISSLLKPLPQRVTHSDRIQNFDTERSFSILQQGKLNPRQLLEKLGIGDVDIESMDTTDGLRLHLTNSVIIHLRPSGNAPELRCYVEAETMEISEELVRTCLENIQKIN